MKRLLEVAALFVVAFYVAWVGAFSALPTNGQVVHKIDTVVAKVAIPPVSVEQIPLYLPAADEPVSYVAERFGLEIDGLLAVNPHLEGEGVVTNATGALLPLQPESVDVAGPVVVRNYGVTGFEVPSAEEVLGFLNEHGWSSTSLIVDVVPTVGGVLTPSEVTAVILGRSFHRGVSHYAVVYLARDGSVSQERYLWHELCHEALDSGDETRVNECAREQWETLHQDGVNRTICTQEP